MIKLVPLILVSTTFPLFSQSIIGDNYQFSGSYSSTVFGPVNDNAAISSGFTEIFNIFGDSGNFRWVDQDSFEVTIEFPNNSFDFSLTLSGLDFKSPSGQALDIESASFNYADSVYDTFFFDPVNNPTGAFRPSDPIVSSTANSVTVEFGSDWSGQLAADAPYLRFDIKTVAIPEPASSCLLVLGLTTIGFRRRRG